MLTALTLLFLVAALICMIPSMIAGGLVAIDTCLLLLIAFLDWLLPKFRRRVSTGDRGKGRSWCK